MDLQIYEKKVKITEAFENVSNHFRQDLCNLKKLLLLFIHILLNLTLFEFTDFENFEMQLVDFQSSSIWETNHRFKNHFGRNEISIDWSSQEEC